MSSNYCVQLMPSILVGAMTIVNPINFTSLQFSLSVNSLVIFLFSKYPFNLGYGNNFCVNQDEFGFAQVGQTFNIDLSNYQNYYMLILIYPEGNNFDNVGACEIVPNFTMTFQNTTISSAENITVNSNYDSQEETGFCQGYDVQSTIPGAYCSNYSVYSVISLNSLNNYLVIMTCQGFLIQNNTTVEFVTPSRCNEFGGFVSAEIVFGANYQVIDFLNSNEILYSIVSPSECKIVCGQIPCKSFFQILKLLSPPLKYSIISSKLWNEIVQDLYLAYSVYKYINYLMQYPYLQNIYSAILDFYNFYENFEPYPFTSLLKAQKGIPLTVNDFNKLINAIVKLANENNISLQKQLNKVQHDQVVKASQFSNIVYNVNQFLTFNYNQYFLLSCTGNEFNNLLNLISTFLTVLISQPVITITIPTNTYIKNLLMYCNSQTINIYGTINKFILNSNKGNIYLQDFSSINSFILNTNPGLIKIENKSNINNLQINQNPGTIIVQNNATVNTLQIENNTGEIEIEDNAIVENLICSENTGTVNISSTATVINNQCA